jgi:hypothetical protein
MLRDGIVALVLGGCLVLTWGVMTWLGRRDAHASLESISSGHFAPK